jgi:ADP-heptose:LPS heptosyltransferase
LYGIENPELKCKINVTGNDMFLVRNFINTKIKSDNFITIEPHSKINYTKNRLYPFEKWQKIVDVLSKDIKIVQVGVKDSKLLKNVIDATGNFSFKQTARLISWSSLFLSSEGGLTHANTCFDEGKSLVIFTGYQSETMVAYPQNINVNISSHGPCGMKKTCPDCTNDANNHDWMEIVKKIKEELCL